MNFLRDKLGSSCQKKKRYMRNGTQKMCVCIYIEETCDFENSNQVACNKNK